MGNAFEHNQRHAPYDLKNGVPSVHVSAAVGISKEETRIEHVR